MKDVSFHIRANTVGSLSLYISHIISEALFSFFRSTTVPCIMFENKTNQHIGIKLFIQIITSLLWSKMVRSL